MAFAARTALAELVHRRPSIAEPLAEPPDDVDAGAGVDGAELELPLPPPAGTAVPELGAPLAVCCACATNTASDTTMRAVNPTRITTSLWTAPLRTTLPLKRPFVACSLLLASIVTLAQSPPAALTLGILRRDALIIPFATFDGKQWRNFWPTPEQDADVPLSLASVPKPWWGPIAPIATWQIWTGDAMPRTVKVRQPDWARAYCQKQVGLRTDYQPREWPPPPETQPFPKDGLAVWPPHQIDPIDILPDAGSAERDGLTAVALTAFARAETAAVQAAVQAHFGQPRQFVEVPGDSDRAASPPMSIEAAYASGPASSRVYFVETVREYRKRGSCAAVAFGTGWLRRDEGKVSVTSYGVRVDACGRTGLKFMFPLGALSIAGNTFWVFQSSGWNGESYHTFNTNKRSSLLGSVTQGGAC